MAVCLKTFINLLLILVAFQVFNLNTAQCAAAGQDDSVTANHALSYVAEHYLEKTVAHYEHRDNAAGQRHGHHHKCSWKKFFPGKVVVTCTRFTPAMLVAGVPEYYTAVRDYRSQYFKTINPPPSKA